MKKLQIGGVPEHFNMPWQLLVKSKKLLKKEIELHWKDFPGGTGAMIEGLNSGELDIAILLTEGAIKGIDVDGKFKILGVYVASPLIWGIHVPATSDFQQMEDVKGKRYAISRFGSGSHLMAYVDAQNRSWSTDELKFEVVGNLDGARKAFQKEEAEIFLWEKFTTKKYVDNGEFRRIGECPTPWPCFVICASNEALKGKKKEIRQVLKQIFKKTKKLYNHKEAVSIIAGHYELKEEDVRNWMQDLKWAEKLTRNKKVLKQTIGILQRLNLVSSELGYRELIHKI